MERSRNEMILNTRISSFELKETSSVARVFSKPQPKTFILMLVLSNRNSHNGWCQDKKIGLVGFLEPHKLGQRSRQVQELDPQRVLLKRTRRKEGAIRGVALRQEVLGKKCLDPMDTDLYFNARA